MYGVTFAPGNYFFYLESDGELLSCSAARHCLLFSTDLFMSKNNVPMSV